MAEMATTRLPATAWVVIGLVLVSLAGCSTSTSDPAGDSVENGATGVSITLVAPEGTDEEVLDQAVATIQQRIAALEQVQQPEIIKQGRRIIVKLPGIADRERAVAAVATTGELTFRPVLDFGVGISPAFLNGTLPMPEEGAAPTVPPTNLQNIDPETGLTVVDDPTQESYLAAEDGVTFYHLGPAFVFGSDIAYAEAQFIGTSPTAGEWVVDPAFTPEGGEKFRAGTAILAREPVGSPTRSLAIALDDVVFSAPALAPEVGPEGLDPDIVIITVGGENPEGEARDLAAILRYGALPVSLEVAEVNDL